MQITAKVKEDTMKNGSTNLPALYELATEYQDALMTLTDMDDEAVLDT